MKSTIGIIIWMIGVLAFLGGMFFFVVGGISLVYEKVRPERIEVAAVAMNVRAEYSEESEGPGYWEIVGDYEYRVDGRIYRTARHIDALIPGSKSNTSKLASFMAAHPPGHTLLLYYDPSDPSDARAWGRSTQTEIASLKKQIWTCAIAICISLVFICMPVMIDRRWESQRDVSIRGVAD